MAAEARAIRCEIRPPIAEIVLDRPQAGNTFTPELLTELAEVTSRLATESSVRAVVLRGAGKNFCFGASVDMFLEEPPDRMIGGASQSFETHLEEEAVAIVRAAGSADADEGFRAFRERRAPRFKG
jgi:enoyl-CoA hydratase/carnithine racemase